MPFLAWLDGGNKTRLFSIAAGASLTLRGVGLRGGFSATAGGALVLAAGASLRLERSVLHGNTALIGGAIAAAHHENLGGGPAISAESSIFSHNAAVQGSGGVLFVWGSGAAGRGGAATTRAAMDALPLIEFSASRFVGNVAVGRVVASGDAADSEHEHERRPAGRVVLGEGGALFVAHARLVVRDCDFSSNLALEGGAVAVRDAPSVLLERTSFTANRVAGQGGAVSHAGTGDATARSCVFLEVG